jgi:cation diffusion facilitator CzcD-associated flavoprotein CzcO/acetyl esterase/lipase
MVATSNAAGAAPAEADVVDVLVVGAGFSGLYLLHRLRQLGFSTKVVEVATDVGGTWYWNRYPGARCDVPTTDYTYSFDPELEREWTWTEKYATQPEILAYLRHVADRYDLRPDIRFETGVVSAEWSDGDSRWNIRLTDGSEIVARYYVMATGCLSVPKDIDIEGAGRFAGETYFTSRWPHDGVDLTAKRVAVIGTGSSGIQSIPLIAAQASQLTVFQRTPNFAIPAHNGPPAPETLAAIEADRGAYREAARWSRIGVPGEPTLVSALASPEEVRRARFEAAWEEGTLWGIINCFSDTGVNVAANEILSEMIREKIRSVVDDPETAEALCPKDHPFGTKRPCLDTDYFQTYNLPHVRLVDLRTHPISAITETGIDTVDESMDFDVIVFATGFDAMTGALVAVDVTGRDGVTLEDRWAEGPSTYLGLTSVGFPNFFMVTGPGSPSVFSNMAVSIEQHADWIAECLTTMRAGGFETIEPTPVAEAGWQQHAADCAALGLYDHADSWYVGANIPGKPRVLLPYAGGVGPYRGACEDVAARGYLGFVLDGPGGRQCNDGVVRRLQPDMAMVLEAMAAMGLPAIESLPVADARGFMDAMAAERPPGPEVGEIVDGTLPGAVGSLAYRVYRPATPGPHPVTVYFHGGGWVLGGPDSDDPLCRDLCARSESIIVSVDYRHAPEDRFPAAPDDAVAAVNWIGAHLVELGGIPGSMAVAGWSAGGNLAAIVSQVARDAGGPDITGQLLLTPVTDYDPTRPSFAENSEGYVLTTPLMEWFWDHYADPAHRRDPRAAPLRAADLSGLPPAVVVTADFDPLRDEGVAYAEALRAAGVPVQHIRARGHTHTSVTMVDVVLSGGPVRAEMARALRGFFRATVPG